MNAMNSVNKLAVYTSIINTINTLGLGKYVAMIVRDGKSEIITIAEILENETLDRNQRKLLQLAYRLSIENKL